MSTSNGQSRTDRLLQPLGTTPGAPDADDYRFRPYTLQEARAAARLAGEGLSTGFKALDTEGFRFHAGKLYAVVGRPSEGKTALLLELAMRNATATNRPRRGPAVFVSYEENLHSIYLRLLLRQTAVILGPEKLRAGEMPSRLAVETWLITGSAATFNGGEQIGKLLTLASAAIDEAAEARRLVLIDGDTDGGEIDTLVFNLRRNAEASGVVPSLVVVDYFQKIRVPSDLRGAANRQVQLQEVADTLRRYAKGEPEGAARAVPVVVGAQVNRETVEKDGKTVQPELHNIREADDLANDAAGVLTLHRPDAGRMSIDLERLSTKVVKNRDGRRNAVIDLGFHGPSGLVADAPSDARPQAIDLLARENNRGGRA